ncbi:MAG: DUF1232 domain-containing protein [Fibrobacter sp.]|nr:DUF1232 domain-containing protein [Fibrobacter sp.]
MKKEKIYEGEVHDMKDMERNQRKRREEYDAFDHGRASRPGNLQNGASPIWKALSVLIALAALAYDVSPVDAIPDGIPVLGWLDDLGMTVMAALNVYQQFAKDQNSTLVKLIRYTKWMLVALVVIAGVVVGGIVTLIIHLVMQA